ncbi:MAG: MarC family protein, partial [Thiohalorhabdaceae bacterium]
MDWILNAFVVLFVVVDPVGNAPIFAGLTRGQSDAERWRTAVKGVTLAAAILLAFFVVG